MSRITITLHIDVPDGMVPDVDYQDAPADIPPHALPAWPAPAYDPDEMVRPVANPAPGCPQHGAMSRFPAGVNKAGKAYNASWRCAVKDCQTKPIWDRDAA